MTGNPYPHRFKVRAGFALAIVLALLGVQRQPVVARYEVQEPAAVAASESMVVPFTGGWYAATSGNEYSGVVTVTVTGIGQASGTQYTDAFYQLADFSGNPITPTAQPGWVLAINGVLAKELITDHQTPAYRADHTYTFQINAPDGRLSFGVADTYTPDNTGSYSVTIIGPGGGCPVPFFSQPNTDWFKHPLRTDPQASNPSSAEYSTIVTGGCLLTSERRQHKPGRAVQRWLCV